MIDRINAITAAAFGHIKSFIENRHAPEIVVLAGFVGCRRIGRTSQRVNLTDRKTKLVTGGVSIGALLLTDYFSQRAAIASGNGLNTGVSAQRRQSRVGRTGTRISRVTHHKIGVGGCIQNGGTSIVTTVTIG